MIDFFEKNYIILNVYVDLLKQSTPLFRKGGNAVQTITLVQYSTKGTKGGLSRWSIGTLDEPLQIDENKFITWNRLEIPLGDTTVSTLMELQKRDSHAIEAIANAIFRAGRALGKREVSS